MDIKNRFAKRYTSEGSLEIVILKDENGNLLDTRLGPFSTGNPPNSVEFPNWATLKSVVEDHLISEDYLSVNRVVVTGPATWTPSSIVGAKPVKVTIKATNATNSSIFIDTEGVESPINTGDEITFSADVGGAKILDSDFTVDVKVGDSVIIEYMIVVAE